MAARCTLYRVLLCFLVVGSAPSGCGGVGPLLDDDDSVGNDDDSVGNDDDSSSPPDCPDPWTSGQEPRLQLRTAEAGFTEPLEQMGDDTVGNVSLIVADLNGDQELDVVGVTHFQEPFVYSGDGEGGFVAQDFAIDLSTVPPPTWEEGPQNPGKWSLAVVDLNGDELPELLLAGAGYSGTFIARLNNLGGFNFGQPEVLYESALPYRLIGGVAVADLNQDGWLDMVLPMAWIGEVFQMEEIGHPVLLGKSDGSYELFSEVRTTDGGDTQSLSLADFDGDGRIDVLVPPDALQGYGLYRNVASGNDAGMELVEIAEEVGLGPGVEVNGMGTDVTDLNGDGLLDFVVTDLGPPRLLMSSPGGFIDSGAALGLQPAKPAGNWAAIGWSADWADLNNDGWVDLVHASGREEPEDFDGYPDLVWEQRPDGVFEDRSSHWGFTSTWDHYGQAVADVNGDGFLDIVTGGIGETLQLYLNRCDEASWISVELAGSPGNSWALGARVEVEMPDGRHLVRQIQGLRSMGQGPPRAHFGLGDLDGEVRMTVRWPDDGQVVTYELATRAHHRLAR